MKNIVLNLLARADKIFATTKLGNFKFKATVINPAKASAPQDPSVKATKPIDQFFDYAVLKNNGAFSIQIAKGVTLTHESGPITFYPQEINDKSDAPVVVAPAQEAV
jgi:hypothetical protein|tara:strand:- start:249 stop:569 length:321 start_codon:yes stop_codon:yes gene_type:complete